MENIIAKNLNQGGAPELSIKRTNVVRAASTNRTSAVSAVIRETLDGMYRERAAEAAKNKKQEVVTERLKGQLTATAGSNLPEDAGVEQTKAYEATKFIKDTIPAFQEVTKSFGSEEYRNFSKQEREEILQETYNDVLLLAEESGVSENPAVLEYLNTQLVNTNADSDAAITEHVQQTLPARTISNMFDIQRGSVVDPSGMTASDKNSWKAIFDAANTTADEAGMPDGIKRKHLYSEVSRMIDSGDMSAYETMRGHRLWNKLSTDQKSVLQKGATNLQAKQRKNVLDSMAANFKRTAAQAIAVGDVTAIEDSLSNLQKLPASEFAVIASSINKTYNDSLDFMNTVELGDSRMNGYTNIEIDEDQADQYFNYRVRERKLKSGTGTTTQQAGQDVAADMASNGIYSSESQRYFNLNNPVFLEGRIDVQTATSIDGATKLDAQGLTPRQMERIMGTESLEMFQHYKGFREKNLDMNAAMAAGLEQMNNARSAPEGEKFEKAMDFITDTNDLWTGTKLLVRKIPWNLVGFSLLQEAITNVNLAGRAVTIGLPEAEENTLASNASTFIQGVTRQDDFNAAVSDSGRTRPQFNDPGFFARQFTNVSEEVNASANRLELSKMMQRIEKNNPTLTKEAKNELAKKQLRGDSIVANGALITDQFVVDELMQVAGDRDTASAYASEAMQVGAMLSSIDPNVRDEVVSSMYTHYVDGEEVDISTDEGMRLLMNSPEDSVESILSFEKLREVVVSGITINGQEIPPLKDGLSKLAGFYDAGGALFGNVLSQAPITKSRYLAESKSFYIEVMDTGGDPLTTDKDLFVQRGAGKSLDSGSVTQDDEIALPRGTQLTNNLPLSFVKDYIKAVKTSSFK